MLVRGVVRNEIQQYTDVSPMCLGDELVEVGQRSEDRIDVAVVRDVVAEVLHRRAEDRRDPDRVDAQPLQVIESLDDARNVAGAVTVRILERPRIDLIDDPALPPGSGARSVRGSLVSGSVWRAHCCVMVPHSGSVVASRPSWWFCTRLSETTDARLGAVVFVLRPRLQPHSVAPARPAVDRTARPPCG